MADEERPMAMFGEIGSARGGVDANGRPAGRDVPNELRGDRKLRLLREMRQSDAIIGALIMAIKMIARSVPWTSEPNQHAAEGDAEAEAARQFLYECMHDMSHPWSEFIDDSLDAVWAGFAVPEVVLKPRLGQNPGVMTIPCLGDDGQPTGETMDIELAPSEFDDGRVGWRKIAYRDPMGVTRWDIDENGGINGFYHHAEGQNEEVFIPIDKVILFRASRDGNSPYGYSWLTNAFESWQYKRKHQWLEAVGQERAGLGLPVVRMPMGADTREGATDITRARNLVKNIRTDTYAGVILPPALGSADHQKWDLELMSTGANASQYADNIIKRYISEIMTSVLAQFLVQGMNPRGAYAMSKDHRDLWQLAISGLMKTWEELINRFLVRPLFMMNQSAFPDSTKWPRIVSGDVADIAIDQLVTFIHSMYTDGVLDVSDEDRNRIRDVIGWPAETQEQIDKRHEEEELRKEQEQMLMQAQQSGAQGDDNNDDQNTDPKQVKASEQWSELEQFVGKPIEEWNPDDLWNAAFALADEAE